MLTQARLQQLLEYDPETGVFVWRSLRNCNARAGQIAGTINHSGYRIINIDRKLYGAQRLAWLYVHGEFPPNDTDHINFDRQDNRICNLRPATRSQNKCNRPAQSDNTSGYKGVTWRKNRAKWQAQIKLNGRNFYLGQFDDPAEAHAAYAARAVSLHGEFARAV